MPSQKTLQDAERRILVLCREDLNTPFMDLADGSTSTPTIGTLTTLAGVGGTQRTSIYEAACELARTCYPIEDTAVSGGVWQYKLTSGGTGYSTATITPTSGGGTGATATTIVSGGVIVDMIPLTYGTGYTSAPTVAFTVGTGAVATSAINTVSVGLRLLPLHTLGCSVVGQVIWAPIAVKYNATAMKLTTRLILQQAVPAYQTESSGSPTHIYIQGDTIGLHPPPDTSYVLTVEGLALPKRPTYPTDTFDWCNDDIVELLALRAAATACNRNPDLQFRVPDLMAEYNRGRMDLWSSLSRDLRSSFYPNMPGG